MKVNFFFFKIGALTRIERDLTKSMTKKVGLHEARVYQLLRFVKPEKRDGFTAHLCERLLARLGSEGLREMPDIEPYLLDDDAMHSGRREEFFATIKGWGEQEKISEAQTTSAAEDECKRLRQMLTEAEKQLGERGMRLRGMDA